MRLLVTCTALLAAVAAAGAERHKPAEINAGTPEGKLLEQIGGESDEAKKAALLEDFAAKYPKHEGAAWVYEQMVTGYSKAGQYDKALDAGDKLLAADPADVEGAYACLQAAEAKKDAGLIVKWSAITSGAARKMAGTPKPDGEREAEEWARRIDYAKQVDIRSEYSLYAAMLQTSDPKQKIQLGEALEQRNPQSQYLPQMTEQRFQACVQTGDNAKAAALAEKSVESGQASPEMLLVLANKAMGAKQPDKAIAYARKAIEAAEAKPKPDGVSDADWQSWKTQVTTRGHWMAGMTHAGENKWAQADQELRVALPGLKDNRAMLAEALFYAGLANYKLAEAGDTKRARDALRFNEQCAAIAGPLQARASTNVKAIRSRYHIR